MTDVSEMLDVVSVLVRSPDLETYRVGITMDNARRRRQYLKYSEPKPWPHMVFLAFDLGLEKAQQIEKQLFEACTSASKRHALWSKYDAVVRDGTYRKSAGGKSQSDDSRYCVYVAWCNKD